MKAVLNNLHSRITSGYICNKCNNLHNLSAWGEQSKGIAGEIPPLSFLAPCGVGRGLCRGLEVRIGMLGCASPADLWHTELLAGNFADCLTRKVTCAKAQNYFGFILSGLLGQHSFVPRLEPQKLSLVS